MPRKRLRDGGAGEDRAAGEGEAAGDEAAATPKAAGKASAASASPSSAGSVSGPKASASTGPPAASSSSGSAREPRLAVSKCFFSALQLFCKIKNSSEPVHQPRIPIRTRARSDKLGWQRLRQIKETWHLK